MGELGSNGESDAGLLSHLHRNKIEKRRERERERENQWESISKQINKQYTFFFFFLNNSYRREIDYVCYRRGGVSFPTMRTLGGAMRKRRWWMMNAEICLIFGFWMGC